MPSIKLEREFASKNIALLSWYTWSIKRTSGIYSIIFQFLPKLFVCWLMLQNTELYLELLDHWLFLTKLR